MSQPGGSRERQRSPAGKCKRPPTQSSLEVDMKFEAVVIPVANVDRAKDFYSISAGVSTPTFDSITASGSCNLHRPVPGAQSNSAPTSPRPHQDQAHGLYLVVSDIQAACGELASRAVKVSDVFHAATPGAQFQPDGTPGRVNGPAPNHATYSSFATFSDPDGNSWLLQQVTTRLPGRIDPGTTTFSSASDLASALRRAEAAHGQHEKRTGQRDAKWSDWYAEYMVAEQAGTALPT